MKILILTNKLPYPPKDGGSIATLNMLTGLRDAGNELSCLALNTSKHAFPVQEIPPEIGGTIRFMGVDCDNSIKPVRMILNLVFSREPYIAQRFNIPEYRAQLIALLGKERFDIIQLEGPYLGHYLADIRKMSSATISLRTHNVEHLIWKKKATNEKSPWRRLYLKNMALRLEKFEMKIARQSDCLIPISQTDADYFKSHGCDQAMQTCPTGLSIRDYPISPLPSEPSIFFIGALDWLPNQEGLLWFLDKVFHQVLEKVPGLSFHVAGRNAPKHFEKRLRHPNITYHGEVKDARKFMQSYRVMVVPLLTGSGIRIKILEGMALGRPVVTTHTGMDGIPAENTRSVFVSDDSYIFTSQLISLLNEEVDLARTLSTSRDLITQNFDTFGLSTRLSQFFKTQV
ncbi:MAG: glycosyltransferase family 4 protein [Bacteroidota bacterium]